MGGPTGGSMGGVGGGGMGGGGGGGMGGGGGYQGNFEASAATKQVAHTFPMLADTNSYPLTLAHTGLYSRILT